GYLKAMDRRGIPVNPDWVLPGEFHQQAGYDAIRRLLASGKPLPSAIVAANDSVAFGAMRALKENGLRIPQDISIIGFDDHALSALHQPALTTIRIDFRAMTSHLTAALVKRIERPESPVEPLVVPSSELVIRESCRSI